MGKEPPHYDYPMLASLPFVLFDVEWWMLPCAQAVVELSFPCVSSVACATKRFIIWRGLNPHSLNPHSPYVGGRGRWRV